MTLMLIYILMLTIPVSVWFFGMIEERRMNKAFQDQLRMIRRNGDIEFNRMLNEFYAAKEGC